MNASSQKRRLWSLATGSCLAILVMAGLSGCHIRSSKSLDVLTTKHSLPVCPSCGEFYEDCCPCSPRQSAAGFHETRWRTLDGEFMVHPILMDESNSNVEVIQPAILPAEDEPASTRRPIDEPSGGRGGDTEPKTPESQVAPPTPAQDELPVDPRLDLSAPQSFQLPSSKDLNDVHEASPVDIALVDHQDSGTTGSEAPSRIKWLIPQAEQSEASRSNVESVALTTQDAPALPKPRPRNELRRVKPNALEVPSTTELKISSLPSVGSTVPANSAAFESLDDSDTVYAAAEVDLQAETDSEFSIRAPTQTIQASKAEFSEPTHRSETSSADSPQQTAGG